MKQFSESFYTDDFDQEMLDWLIAEGYAVWDNHGNTPSLDRLHLRCASATAFWTTSNPPTFDFGSYLTKNQFKEKIGMTDKKSDKQEKKIKHWVVETLPENIKHPRTFIAATLKDTKSGFNGVKDNGAYYDCLKRRWKYTPVYEEECVSEELPNTFTKSMLVSGKNVVKIRKDEYFLLLEDKLVDKNSYLRLGRFKDSLTHSYCDEHDIVSVYEMTDNFILDDLSSGENLTLIWQRETPEQAQKRIRKQELEDKVVALRQELKQAENELQEL